MTKPSVEELMGLSSNEYDEMAEKRKNKKGKAKTKDSAVVDQDPQLKEVQIPDQESPDEPEPPPEDDVESDEEDLDDPESPPEDDEQEVSAEEPTKRFFRMMTSYYLTINGVSCRFKRDDLISDPHILNALLSDNAPMEEVFPESMRQCPKCQHIFAGGELNAESRSQK